MNLPEEITKLPQWVVNRKDSKLPYNAKSFPLTMASVSDKNTWSTFEQAYQAVEYGAADYLGFVFADNGIVGIDLDKGFEDNGIMPTAETLDILSHVHSYTEKSKSGRGFHILVKGKLPFKGKNNRKGVEIYQEGRYFITTGRQMLYADIIENQEGIDYVLEKYFQEDLDGREDGERESKDKPRNPRYYTVEWEYSPNNISLEPHYPPIPQGCRNQSLTSLAGQYHSQGYSLDEIYNLVMIANEAACDPPLDSREVRSIVRSVSRYKRIRGD